MVSISTICTFLAFIFMFYMVSGCEYERNNCTFDVFCTTSVLNLNLYNMRDNGDHNNCNKIYVGNIGIDLEPIRVVLINVGDTDDIIPRCSHDSLFRLIFSLDVSKNSLGTTRSFYEMENLKMLNLSSNDLDTAALYNKYKLNRLEILDLSHNIIDSIQVDYQQYVYKNLRSLNLSHNFLTYIPYGIFETFKLLDHLDLSDNKLAVINQYSFEGLKNLKFLYLSSNNITDIDVSVFAFSHLEELYLDNNNIEKFYQQDFGKLNSLRLLNLDFNRIDRITAETFNSLESLTTVKLNHNLLNFVHKDAFTSNNYLKFVDFSSNLLNNLPKNLFRYKNITSFSVAENMLMGPLSRGIFEGLQLITILDISFQTITAIEDYAFFGLDKLVTLSLNNNVIRTVSKFSLKTLKSLSSLDLSNNFIISLDFDKSDLISLEFFSLRKNLINGIQKENFQDLTGLRFLDISSNNISGVKANSFKFLQSVETFKIFDNPLRGALTNNSFQGLVFPPVLDLSFTMLTSVENGSFNGMTQLQELNVSHSSIQKIEFNAFINTGSLKLLDASYNKLVSFYINCSDVTNLTTILLNNNYLIHISNDVFKGMPFLNKVTLSYNNIQSIENTTFKDQVDLRYLDLSFNYNLILHISTIEKVRNLEKLFLSGLRNDIDFFNTNFSALTELEISHSTNMFNVSELHLNSMKSLVNLVLKNNSITKLGINDFYNVNALQLLDLSYNKISFIQPGTFKNNVFLYKLNLSHNMVTSLNYGIFRGLINLGVLDVSFNSIYDLSKAKFYDTVNLKILIADSNKISEVSEDFPYLELLSIGDNPLSCEKISYMKYKERMRLGTLNKDETSNHNVDGITCKNENSVHDFNVNKQVNNVPMLAEIRDLLLNISKTNAGINPLKVNNNSGYIPKDISDAILNLGTDQMKEQIQLKNITYHVADEIDRTNSFLERILKVIVGLGPTKGNSAKVEKNIDAGNIGNGTSMNSSSTLNALISDVSEMKRELMYLENIMSEIDQKLTISRTLNNIQESQKSNKTDVLVEKSSAKSFVFIEVCVSLILIIIVCFFLYKFYQSKMFISSSRSMSTRHITESVDNSNL